MSSLFKVGSLLSYREVLELLKHGKKDNCKVMTKFVQNNVATTKIVDKFCWVVAIKKWYLSVDVTNTLNVKVTLLRVIAKLLNRFTKLKLQEIG